MKLKEDSSVQKLRGAYYTPLPLAEMMVKLFANRTDCKNVLEPSCGDGVFLDALIKADCIKQYADIDAVEIDGAEAKKVKGRMKAYKNVKVINEDLCTVVDTEPDPTKEDGLVISIEKNGYVRNSEIETLLLSATNTTKSEYDNVKSQYSEE